MNANNAGHSTVNHMILEALAEVRRESYTSLAHDMGQDGSGLSITAKEQPAVVAILEDHLDCGPLLGPQDLGKDKKQANSCLCPLTGTTVKQLGEVILSKVPSLN